MLAYHVEIVGFCMTAVLMQGSHLGIEYHDRYLQITGMQDTTGLALRNIPPG